MHPIQTYEEVFGGKFDVEPVVETRTGSENCESLDARVLFPLPHLPWTPTRSTVWRAQKISDPMAALKLALAYEEEVQLMASIGYFSYWQSMFTAAERARLTRRLMLTAEAYRARVAELEAGRRAAERCLEAILESSSYLDRHPEMRDEFLAGGGGDSDAQSTQ